MGLTYAIALATALAGLGAALDKLLLPHQAAKLRYRLLRFWNRVDDVRFSNVPEAMVEFYIHAEQRAFGKRFTARWATSVLLSSALLTSVTIVVGRALGLYLTGVCSDPSQSSIDLGVALRAGLTYFWVNVHHAFIYPLNLSFDAVTVAVTVTLLSWFLAAGGRLKRYAFLLADILLCVVLLVLCFFIAFRLDATTSGDPPSLTRVLPRLIGDFTELGCAYFHVYLSTIFFVSTITIPTLLYLLMILLFLMAKSASELGQWIVLHIVELGTVGEKSVFFYTGIFFGIIVIVLKLIQESVAWLGL